jgi:hypothetical protein
MMLGKPDSAVSEPVGEHDLLHALIECTLDPGFGQIRGFEFKKKTYVHARSSCTILRKILLNRALR